MPHDVVAELIRENANLAARNSELSRALAQVEAVSQLTVGVVHDLRNAFHVMLMAADGLRMHATDPMQRELAGEVLSAGNHAAEMARDLLAFARKEGARTTLIECAPFFAEFRRLVERILLKRIACEFQVDPGVWPIRVDRQQLMAALLNLGLNARDAMPQGGSLRIRARNRAENASVSGDLPPGDYVEIEVADTGLGMAPEVVARATEAFYTTKGAAGTGLGLAMVQSFVTRSGGALSIESEVERGTRVKLFLPRGSQPPRRRADERIDRIQGRIHSQWLRCVLQAWREACPEHGLPRPLAVEAGLLPHVDCSIVLAVERNLTPPSFRLVLLGETLANALGRGALGEVTLDGSLVLGRLGAAYRRALRSRAPSYEYARYAFGDGAPAEFERLILPAAADGETVSHLIGLVHLPKEMLQGRGAHVTVR